MKVEALERWPSRTDGGGGFSFIPSFLFFFSFRYLDFLIRLTNGPSPSQQN
jgi:hypothetical protein